MKFCMNNCVFMVARSQEPTARGGWQEAMEPFPVVLHGKVCGAGFSRPRAAAVVHLVTEAGVLFSGYHLVHDEAWQA